MAELLHFLRTEVLQDLGSLVLPQRQQQDGAFSTPSPAGLAAIYPFLDHVGDGLGILLCRLAASASFSS
jgi:hypothetical protein